MKVDRDEVRSTSGSPEGVIPARAVHPTTSILPRSSSSARPSRPWSSPGGQGGAPDPVQEAGPVRAGLGQDRGDQGGGVVSGPVIEVVSGRPHPRHRPAGLPPRRLAGGAAPGATCSPTWVAASRPRSSSSTRTGTTSCCRAGPGWRRPRRSSARFLDNLKPGEIRTGTVSSVVNFGAFVDLGGSGTASCTSPELSWKHVDHPGSVVGDEIQVQVPEVDLGAAHQPLAARPRQDPPGRSSPPTTASASSCTAGSPSWSRSAPSSRWATASRGPVHISRCPPTTSTCPSRSSPRARAVGQDHRPRPPAPSDQPVDQAGRRGWRRGRGVPGALRRARLRHRGHIGPTGVRRRHPQRRPGRGPSTTPTPTRTPSRRAVSRRPRRARRLPTPRRHRRPPPSRHPPTWSQRRPTRWSTRRLRTPRGARGPAEGWAPRPRSPGPEA